MTVICIVLVLILKLRKLELLRSLGVDRLARVLDSRFVFNVCTHVRGHMILPKSIMTYKSLLLLALLLELPLTKKLLLLVKLIRLLLKSIGLLLKLLLLM